MDEAPLKGVLPHSIEAEHSVIGSMLMDKEAIISASEIVTINDFYQHQYGVTFESTVELFNEGKPVDLVTLQNCLKKKDVSPEVNSLEFVRDITTTAPISANVKSYANIAREKVVLRRLIKVDKGIVNTCYAGKDKLEDILAHAEKAIFDSLQNRISGELVPIRRVTLNVLENIERASKNKDTVTGMPSGFTDSDYKISGFWPPDFILIAAHPSMGKIAFVSNVVDNVTVKKGLPCMAFSLRMFKEQLINRMFSMESNVDSQKLRVGALTDSDWDAVVEGIGVIGNSKLIIDDTPGTSITELRSRCRKTKLEHGLSLVIIDYSQLMSGNGKNGDNRQQEISEIPRSLRALVRGMQASVIMPPQLSRACETGQDHRPMLSDPRESGVTEQDADAVTFLYHDDYYNKDTEDRDIVEVTITKQRNSPVDMVNLVWTSQYTKSVNAVRQPYEQQTNR